MTDDDIPQVILMPAAQAQLDADPALAEAMKGIKEAMLNAMQGVKDGRYNSFEDAVEAMGLERPQIVSPPNPPKHGYYLSCGPDPNSADGVMAVITDGHPSEHHATVEVLDMECFKSIAEAQEWFNRTCPALPWRKDSDDD